MCTFAVSNLAHEQELYTDCARKIMSEVTVEINGKELELNPFTESIIESTIKGLLSPLKGYEEGIIAIKINGGDTEI